MLKPLTEIDIKQIEIEIQENKNLDFKELFIKKLVNKNSNKCENHYQINSELVIEIFKIVKNL